jgi:hypothetical protein
MFKPVMERGKGAHERVAMFGLLQLPAFPHFLISLEINHHVPEARLFDSEESRKRGNESWNSDKSACNRLAW